MTETTKEKSIKVRDNSPQVIMGEGSIEKATKVSGELAKIIDTQKLYAVIQGKKFVTVEGWTTLGAMTGVFPEVVRTERIVGEPKEIKYLAEVKLKGLNGVTVSSAQSICSNKERSKIGADEYVISSMAQTRATGKAFRLAFSWVMKMAGYEATPMEEMTEVAPQPEPTRAKPIMEQAKDVNANTPEYVMDLKKRVHKFGATNDAGAFRVIKGRAGVDITDWNLTEEQCRDIMLGLDASEMKEPSPTDQALDV